MNRKTIYYIVTALMSALFLFSASMYFIKYQEIVTAFEGWGWPGWLVYPLAIAKILGVIAIWTRKSKVLKEWAYAGFFFDAILATATHFIAGDNGQWMAIGAGVLVIISRWLDGQVFYKRESIL